MVIDLNKAHGEGGERISVSEFSIKGDGKIISVSACASDKEVKRVN